LKPPSQLRRMPRHHLQINKLKHHLQLNKPKSEDSRSINASHERWIQKQVG
jgi:hypothetical protein